MGEYIRRLTKYVSIQPKPKKGLEENHKKEMKQSGYKSFNPAEAEEGFRSEHSKTRYMGYGSFVSIQPKPKKGLEENNDAELMPAYKVSIQPKPKKGLEGVPT